MESSKLEIEDLKKTSLIKYVQEHLSTPLHLHIICSVLYTRVEAGLVGAIMVTP